MSTSSLSGVETVTEHTDKTCFIATSLHFWGRSGEGHLETKTAKQKACIWPWGGGKSCLFV